MRFKQFLVFVCISLLLHAILLLLAFSSLLPSVFSGLGMVSAPAASQPMTVTMLPQSSGKQIVDTEQSIVTDKPVENTPFEGDRNTQASSVSQAAGNPNLPNIKGRDIPGQDLYDQRYSPRQPGGPPAQPAPARTPQKPAQPTQPAQKPAADNGGVKVTTQAVPVDSRGPFTARDNNQQQANAAAASAAAQPESEPATSFSSSRLASTMPGGASSQGAPSIAVKETEEGRYKVKMYRAIGSRWYQYVHMDSGLLNIGSIKIRFYVHANGTITDLRVEGSGDNTALEAVSRRSIMEVSGQLEPFSQSMREKLGDGFWDDVNFSIY